MTLPEIEALIAKNTIDAMQEYFEFVSMLSSNDLTATEMSQLKDWQHDEKIFSIIHNGIRYYPKFQFLDNQPLPIIGEILKIFATDITRSNWHNLFWFASNNGWLHDGAAPMDMLHDVSVLQAAKYNIYDADAY